MLKKITEKIVKSGIFRFLIPYGSRRWFFLLSVYQLLGGKMSFGRKDYRCDFEKDKDISEMTVITIPKCENPEISIVINFSDLENLYLCVSSILRNTPDLLYKVYLYGDLSEVEKKEMSGKISGIDFIPEIKPSLLSGNFVVLMDDVFQVQKKWLSALVFAFEKHEKIKLVGGIAIDNERRIVGGPGILSNCGGDFMGLRDNSFKPEYSFLREVDFLYGSTILIDKNFIAERFSFDFESFLLLAKKVLNQGGKIFFQPKSVIVTGLKEGKKLIGENVKNKDKIVNVFEYPIKRPKQKTILFIDHMVPTFDKDAGSKSIFQHLKSFINMGFRVKFIPDNFFYSGEYTETLQQMGIEVLYGFWYARNWKKWMMKNAEEIDFVFLSRPLVSIKYIDFIQKNLKAKTLYYGHDLHYLRLKRQMEIEESPELKIQIENFRKIEEKLIAKSDYVLMISEYERKIVEREFKFKKIVDVPVLIYDKFDLKACDFSGRKNILFLGGFNHKPNIDAACWLVNSIFPLIAKKLPDVKLIIAGSNPTEEIFALKRENVVVKGFLTEDELNDYYKNIKLVVVPLRYGAGIKGKVVEAMYNGVPVVSTSIGLEGLKEIDKVLNSYDDPDQFAARVVALYQSENELKEISEKSIQYVKKYFSEDYEAAQFKEIVG